MKANLTISQIYWNKSLMSFFFRKQSEETFMNLLKELDGENPEFDYDTLFERLEDLYESVEEMEEDFYELQISELREKFEL